LAILSFILARVFSVIEQVEAAIEVEEKQVDKTIIRIIKIFSLSGLSEGNILLGCFCDYCSNANPKEATSLAVRGMV